MLDFFNKLFWTGLALFIVIVVNIQYVGVWVIYIGIPFLLITGFLAWLFKPKEEVSLCNERTKEHKRTLALLTYEKEEIQIHYNHESNFHKRLSYEKQIRELDKKIELIQNELKEIRKQCELEVHQARKPR